MRLTVSCVMPKVMRLDCAPRVTITALQYRLFFSILQVIAGLMVDFPTKGSRQWNDHLRGSDSYFQGEGRRNKRLTWYNLYKFLTLCVDTVFKYRRNYNTIIFINGLDMEFSHNYQHQELFHNKQTSHQFERKGFN